MPSALGLVHSVYCSRKLSSVYIKPVTDLKHSEFLIFQAEFVCFWNADFKEYIPSSIWDFTVFPRDKTPLLTCVDNLQRSCITANLSFCRFLVFVSSLDTLLVPKALRTWGEGCKENCTAANLWFPFTHRGLIKTKELLSKVVHPNSQLLQTFPNFQLSQTFPPHF